MDGRSRLVWSMLNDSESDHDLRGCRLSFANRYEANLSNTDLHGADLTETDLSNASLHGADLSKARLQGANLTGADLTEVDLDVAIQ